ncbi:MAG: caspase family protein [Gammaproteobacteria bacterium]|nr:caspase family protein [Gammaproteobacteria bacterium]
MTKKAFLFGSNSGNLQYCKSDVELMAAALRQRGYAESDIIKLHPDDYYTVDKCLDKLLGAVNENDILIVYFAGHTVDTGAGGIKFITGQDMNEIAAQLAAQSFIGKLREHCRKSRKIIILDCCQAGGALDKIPADEEYFRVLAATARDGYARELDKKTLEELTPALPEDEIARQTQGAGFLTWHLYCALTANAPELADEKGELRIERVKKWLEEKAKRFDRPDRKIEQPQLYGRAEDILLADNISLENYFGFPPGLIKRLQALLQSGSSLPAERLNWLANICLARGTPPLAGTKCKPGDLACLIQHFADFYVQPGNGLAVPLLDFTVLLHDALNRPPELEAWLNEFKQWVAGKISLDAWKAPQAEKIKLSQPCLMIESTEEELICYLQNAGGIPRQVALLKEKIHTGIPALLDQAFQLEENDDVRAAFRINPQTEKFPVLQIFMARNRLPGYHPHRLEPKKLSHPLNTHYRIVLRSQERLDELRDQTIRKKQDEKASSDFIHFWVRYWNAAKNLNCRQELLKKTDCEADSSSANTCVIWQSDLQEARYAYRLNKGAMLFVLPARPDSAKLEAMLKAGVAGIAWPAEKTLDSDARSLFCEYLTESPLCELPETVRCTCEILHDDNPDHGGLCLFWDDPEQHPPIDEQPFAYPK